MDHQSSLSFPNSITGEVYALARDLAARNHPHWMDHLERHALKQLRASRIDIMDAIAWLQAEKYILPNTRLTRVDILANPQRVKIVSEIKHHPGVHFRALLRRIHGENISGLVRWHLSMLLNFGIISEFRLGRYHCFFPEPFNADSKVLYVFLQQPLPHEILHYLSQYDEISISQLASSMQMDYSKVMYHINRLVAENLVKIFVKSNQKHVKLIVPIKIE